MTELYTKAEIDQIIEDLALVYYIYLYRKYGLEKRLIFLHMYDDRWPDSLVAEDPLIKALIESKAQVVTIFGKTWIAHVTYQLKRPRRRTFS